MGNYLEKIMIKKRQKSTKCEQYTQLIFQGKVKSRQVKVKNVLQESIKKN